MVPGAYILRCFENQTSSRLQRAATMDLFKMSIKLLELDITRRSPCPCSLTRVFRIVVLLVPRLRRALCDVLCS